MRRLRLHAISWCALVTVCLLLIRVNVHPWGSWWGWVGYPFPFGRPWSPSDLQAWLPALFINVCFAMFSIVGSVTAVELWCRTHGVKLSLLSAFGVMSGFCFCFYSLVKYRVGIEMALEFADYLCNFVLLPVAFGASVVGWVKLVTIAFTKTEPDSKG